MKDVGECTWLLGMSIIRNRNLKQLKISHKTYLQNLLNKFGMLECRPEPTPEAVGIKLSNSQSPITNEQLREMEQLKPKYLSAVGALMYASLSTRPDLAHSVNELSRFMSNPGLVHFIALKRVLRYVKNSLNIELTYDGNLQNNEIVNTNDFCSSFEHSLHVFTDASWGDCPDTRRSTTGYIVKFNNDTITWNSRRQQTVALSTAEAELMAIGSGCQEIIYITNLLKELNLKSTNILYTDNKAALCIAEHDIHHNRTKHIDIKYHFIREQIKNKLFTLQWVPTFEQLGDLLTKSLNRQQFIVLRNIIMNSV